MNQGIPDWVVYANLVISAITPIVTGTIGLVILRLGTRLEQSKQLNQALLYKRLSFFEDVAPRLNDIHCFYQAVGHWAELDPKAVIERKRHIDRAMYINRHLFGDRLVDEYRNFEKEYFELFASAGRPARLRLDTDHVCKLIGEAFKPDWQAALSPNRGSRAEQEKAYENLMAFLGREVMGET